MLITNKITFQVVYFACQFVFRNIKQLDGVKNPTKPRALEVCTSSL